MTTSQPVQALRLLVVALVISAAVPGTSADASASSDAYGAMKIGFALPLGALSVSAPATAFVSDCSATATVQLGDTVSSITAAYGLNSTSVLAAYNTGLNVNKPLSSYHGTSLCVGVGPLCNTPLVGGVCPASAPSAPLVDWSTSTLTVPDALNKAITPQPDLGAILQDPKTTAFLAGIPGSQSLVMVVPPTSAAAKLVSTNSGHPWLNLWVASGSAKPLVITVFPSWFADGTAFYTYIPGSAVKSLLANPVQQAQSLLSSVGLKRNLLSAATSRKLLQGADPPGGGGKGSGCGSWCYGR